MKLLPILLCTERDPAHHVRFPSSRSSDSLTYAIRSIHSFRPERRSISTRSTSATDRIAAPELLISDTNNSPLRQYEALGAGFDARYVPPAQVGCEELFAAKSTVRWMAQGVCYGVIDKEMYLPLRIHPVNARGFVAGDVQVACGVECQAVGHALETFHEQFAFLRVSVLVYGNADHSASERFCDVKVILVGREGHPVCEGHGPVVPEPSFTALKVESPDSRSLLFGIVAVGDVEAVPGAVYHGEVGDAHLGSASPACEVDEISCSRVEAENGGVARSEE